MKATLEWLVDDAPSVDQLVDELPQRLECVVVTKEESARLPDDGTPEARYDHAGLDLHAFRPLDEWDA